MMRIAFFVFLFANLVMLLWQTQIARSNREADLPAVPAEHQLVLLSEFQAEKKQEELAKAEPVADKTGDKAVKANTKEPAKDEPKTVSPVDSLDIPDIVLVDENNEPLPKAPEIKPTPLCFTMGPFRDADLAKVVTNKLKDMNIEAKRRSKVEQEQYGYRVYLPPYATREEAVADTRKLAELGVRDYFIITDDEDKKNGVSLGLFRKKSGAIRRMAQIRRFDFKPQMEIRYRDTTIYWLDYQHMPEVDTDQLLREFTEDTPDLQRLDRDCQVAVK